MKKIIGFFIALIAVFIGKNFAAVDMWQRLDVPASQEFLLVHETKKNDEFIGHIFTTVTLVVDLAHIVDPRFIVCALNAYEDKDDVVEVKFKKNQTSPYELQLKLAHIIEGLKEIFRPLSDAREFLVEGEYLVLREIKEDACYSSGRECEGEDSSDEDDGQGWEENW